MKEADELLTLGRVGNKSNFDWKTEPWWRQPAKNNNDKTEQRRKSKRKKTKGDEWMFRSKSSRTLTVACCSVESIECQQVPSLCFNLLLLLFFFFFCLRYTRLALNYLFWLKREGVVMRRDSALIHPHFADRKLCKYSEFHSIPEQHRRGVLKYT